jgi:hypothetical protein
MKFVELQDLISKLYTEKDPTFLGLHVETVPEMRKGGNPFLGRVYTRQHHNCQINFNYQAAVNRVLDKEGKEADFQASPLKWGTPIEGTPFLVHTKKGDSSPTVYLRTRILHSKMKEFFLDGKFVDSIPLREQILSFIPAKSESYQHQGVSSEHEVIVRTFKMDSIKAAIYRGETYIVEK